MLGALIGAGTSLLGGLLGRSDAKKANKQQQQNALRQEALQKEFAQSGIQWKAEDARKAGISPLYAMGANTASYSPVSVGHSASPMGSAIADAGQNIGRAIQSQQSPSGKVDAYTRAAQSLQLDGLKLDNDLKRTQLASAVRLASQPGTAPGIPSLDTTYGIDGQPDTIRKFETKTDVASSYDPAVVPGTTPEVMLARTSGGGYAPTLPPAMQEALESQGFLAQMQYFIRNNLLPFVDTSRRPVQLRAEAKNLGKRLVFNPITGEYHLRAQMPAIRSKGTY